MARQRRIYPAPEIVLDDFVEIREDKKGGSMDVSNRIMRVPLTGTPRSRHVRAHEMAHAKYSPRMPMVPASIPNVAMQRAEDMRMNVYCRRQGLDEAMDAPTVDDPSILDRLITVPIESADLLSPVTAAASTYNTGDWEPAMRTIRAADSKLADRLEEFIPKLWDRMNSGDPTWDDTLRTAKDLLDFAEHPPESFTEPKGEPGDTGDKPDGGAPGFGEAGEDKDDPGEATARDEPNDGEPDEPDDGEPDDADEDEPMRRIDLSADPMDKLVDKALESERTAPSPDPVEEGIKGIRGYYGSRDKAYDAKLTVTEQRLTKRMAPNKFKTRSKVPTDTGRVPRYMGRYCSDRAVFAGRGKRRDAGGTVIIDCSGSMSMSEEMVDRIMEKAPAGIVATYSGGGMVGDLYVIAKNGKRAEKNLRPRLGGNVVDREALRWAAKKPGPHFWLCDGMVSGGDPSGSEAFTREVVAECAELCRKHRIIRVNNIDELVRAMETVK